MSYLNSWGRTRLHVVVRPVICVQTCAVICAAAAVAVISSLAVRCVAVNRPNLRKDFIQLFIFIDYTSKKTN